MMAGQTHNNDDSADQARARPGRSRRGLPADAAGALGALAAETIVPAQPAAATQGQPVIQQNLSGVYVRSAVPNIPASSFTVHLSKAPSASASVAWFVVN